MNRRGFLGFLAASPVAAKTITDDAILSTSGFKNGAYGANVASFKPVIPDEKQTKVFYDWVAKNGIPEWKMQQLKREASYDRTYGLDPDLACLRSVSANFKARTQLNRNLDKRIKLSLSSVAQRFSSQSFFEKTAEKFGFRFDWYD